LVPVTVYEGTDSNGKAYALTRIAPGHRRVGTGPDL
jgi:hypothetical protein